MIEIGIIKDTPINKIIDIRDKNQVIKAKYAIGKDDILKYTLMAEHYIEISFELNRNASFKRSDYIEWEGDKYTLRDDYQPEQINKRKYKYTLKFEAVEMFFQDMQYWYLGQGLKESELRMTGNPEYFLKYAVENANRYFKTTEFNIGTVEPTEIKDITFEVNTNTFDALTQIADVYGAEWYITGKTIHLLNKVSFGDEVDFETEVSVLSMKREEGESTTRYTRILALGSTRNIPYDYRETTPNEAVDAVYPKRLRIPASKGDVIDAYPNMSPDEVVEGTVIFDEVYPRREGTIEAVGTIEYQDVNEDTGEVTKWNAYKIKDSGINFKKEYLLPGQELKLQFTSGDLNGRDFALIFHEKGFSSSDNSQFYEIVRTDEFGKLLPNDVMKPKAGDKYVLYGFNIALVSDQYVPAGEQELYDVATAWQQKQLRDTGVYECPTVIKHFKDNQMDLAIGQKVKLIFDAENVSTRSSRIMGFEKKLNNKFDAIYTVGDNSTYSRFGKIEQQIKELQIAGVVYENTGGSGVYVIKQFDTTRPTDFNVYSAIASDAKYFNKQTGGTVQGDTSFAKNMQVQGTAIGDVFQNSTFTAGQFGSGFQIKRDANGQSYMEVDNLLVRRETVFNRLTIAEIKSVGGTILLSLASMVLSKVEVKASTWKCFFDTADGTIPNDYALGDQAICRKFTGKDIKYYWALVTAVGADYIELSKTDKDGSGIPAIGDEVVQLGNRTDINRQYAIMLSAYGSAAPSINQYAGINSYDLTGKEVTAISPKGNKFTGSFTVSTNGTTAPVYKERGVFSNGTTYYLNDRVSYLGSYWVCIVNTTITAPSEGSSTWRKDTAGQTDINNAVNNISVGGRNLVPYTNQGAMWWWRTVQNGTHSITETQALGVRAMKATTSVVSTGYNVITKGLNHALLKNNTQYVISFDIYCDYDTASSVSLREGNSANPLTPSYPFSIKKDTWIHIEQVITTNNVAIANQLIYLEGFNKIGSTIFANLKLEEGNKATTWSPAPEDVQAGIDNALNEAEKVRTEYKADFIVLDTKIASKVSQTDFNALGQRVSTTESNITQLSNQITSVVETVDNIKIGTRNVLPNTNQGISGWGAFLQNGTVTRTEVQALGVRACKLTTTVLSTGYHVLYHTINRPLIKNKTQYTLSLDVFSEFATSATFRLIALNAVNSLAHFGTKAIPANTWTHIELTTTTYDNTGTDQYLYITDFNKLGAVTFANLKLEEGNKATSWSPAPEDVQAEIDLKNRTYYQDVVPTVPSGGHKVGDLWYKTSLVDSSGNINADTTKNIYQLQYRWDGTTWRQINWSVSKSKIEQTDSSISLIVEKTGINSVGAGSSLYSMILQTEDKIVLEVSKVQVGGRNLIPRSNQGTYGWYRTVQNGTHSITETQALGVRAMKAITSVVSTGYNVVHKNLNHSLLKNNTQYVVSFDIYSEYNTTMYLLLQAANGVNALTPWYNKVIAKDTWIHVEQIMNTNSTTISNQVLYLQGFNQVGGVTIANLKLEEGNKATTWSPAIEDTQAQIDSKTTLDEVSSSLTITDNKISLASKTIELTGHTIAKSIEAQDLKVGSRTGLSALEVLKDGTFYAKGSTSSNSALIIDSGTQSITITSPKSASGEGSPISGSSNVTISSQSGGVRVDGSTAISSNSATVVSNSGIFANTAGQSVSWAGSSISESRASIVGLGWGKVSFDEYYGMDNFVSGVYGSASNSGNAPAYGGYFQMLRANGFVMSMIDISTSSDQYTSLTKDTSFVLGNSNVMQTVYLPSDAYKGTVIWLKQWWTGYMRIRPRGTQRLFDDSSQNDYIDVGEGWTAMCVFIGEWGTGTARYGTWLISKFKF